MKGWLAHTFAALAIRDFRVLWTGTLFAFVAFFMSSVVQSIVAFELTSTNKAVGFVVFGQGLAMSLLGPLGGALADRWPKRRVIATCQLMTAAVFFGMAVLMDAGAMRVVFLVAASTAVGATFAFLGPSRQAFIAELVPNRQRGNAVALSQVANSVSRVVGPGLAGALLAWEVGGATAAYLAMGVFYSTSALTLVLLPRSRVRDGARQSRVLEDVFAGLRYVFGNPRQRTLVLTYVLVIMVGYPYVTVLPGLVENEFGRAARDVIGLLYGCSAIGALVAGLGVARYADSPSAPAIFSTMGLLFGAMLIVLAMVPTFELSIPAMILIGVTTGGFQTLCGAFVLREAAPEFVGRVMSVTMLAFGGLGVMGLPVGFLADAIGERATLAILGVAVSAIVVWLRLALLRVEPA